MSRYWFDYSDMEQTPEGLPLEYASLDDARTAAMDGLLAAAHEVLPSAGPVVLSVKVRDESGQYVTAASLAMGSKSLMDD